MSENLDDLAKLDQKRAESIEQLTVLLQSKHPNEQVTETELANFGLESGFHDAVRQALSKVNDAKPNIFATLFSPLTALIGEVTGTLLKILVFACVFFVCSQRDYLDFLANKVIATEAIAAEEQKQKNQQLKAEVYRVFAKHGLLDKLKEDDTPSLQAELNSANRWIGYRESGIAGMRKEFFKDAQTQKDTQLVYQKVLAELTYTDPRGFRELRLGVPSSTQVFLESLGWASLGLAVFIVFSWILQTALKENWRIHRLNTELKKIL